MNVYLLQNKEGEIEYVEDYYSSYEIVSMEIDEFTRLLKSRKNWYSCYPHFICHIGRFIREIGYEWIGDIHIYYKLRFETDFTEVKFNDKAQLEGLPFGFFE